MGAALWYYLDLVCLWLGRASLLGGVFIVLWVLAISIRDWAKDME